jgi:hypothetical protein
VATLERGAARGATRDPDQDAVLEQRAIELELGNGRSVQRIPLQKVHSPSCRE